MADYVSKYTGSQIDEAVELALQYKGGGVPAADVVESNVRSFVTAAERALWNNNIPSVSRKTIINFTPSALFSSLGLGDMLAGTFVPFTASAAATNRPFSDTSYASNGYILVLLAGTVMIVAMDNNVPAGNFGRIAYTIISSGSSAIEWCTVGNRPQKLYSGDRALSNNVEASFSLSSNHSGSYKYTTGDLLQIEFAYLGGGTEGHMTGFNQGQTIIYDPSETLTTSFWSIVTNSGSAQQYECQFTIRFSGSTLYIKPSNINSGSVNVASQFRIKGIRVLYP